MKCVSNVPAFGLAAALVFFVSETAHATVHTFNFSYSDSPSTTLDPFFVGGLPGRARIFDDTSGNAPFSIGGFEEGDTISIDVTVSGGGLTFQDLGNPFIGPNESITLAAFNMDGWTGVAPGPVVTYDVATVLTITGFTGSVNATTFSNFIAGPPIGLGGAALPSFTMGASFNITNSMAALTSFNITRTFTNIVFESSYGLSLPMDVSSSGRMLALDDTDVPEPGALALISLGLLGVGAARRELVRR